MTDLENEMTPQESNADARGPDRPSDPKVLSRPSPGILDFAQRLGELVGKWLALHREPRDS